jgi:hypothetical protein
MKRVSAAVVCSGVALCTSVLAAPAAFKLQHETGWWTLYGDRVGTDAGAFTNYQAGVGLTIKILGSQVGGSDKTFSGIQQVVTGGYGPYALEGGWLRSPVRSMAIRLQDQQRTELMTIYFDQGTMEWIAAGPSELGWVMNMYIDQSKPSRVERGPLLDGVIPPGTMTSATMTMRGERFGAPASDSGVLEFARGQVRMSGNVSFTYACRADINNDTVVDDADFEGFIVEYAKMKCDRSDVCRGDFNEDGFVDDNDFAAFALAYDRLLCD